MVVRSLPKSAGPVSEVRLLGHDRALEWSQTDAGLVVKLPARKPCEHAYAIKIAGSHLQAVRVEPDPTIPADGGKPCNPPL